MSFFFLLMIIAAYIALGTFVLLRIFPNAKPGMLATTLGITNALAFAAVVFNGIVPPIPMGPGDLWAFLFVSFGGLTAFNAIGLNQVLNDQTSFIGVILVSAIMNLGLTIVLGAPCFYTLLSLSDFLFKT